jgi:transcriptional regulator with XRE-family HTH domain
MQAIEEHIRLTVRAKLANGCSIAKVAEELGIGQTTVREIRSDDRLKPELVQLASKQLSNRMLLAANGATEILLDKLDDDELRNEKPIELAKIASILTQSAGAYAQQCGNGNTLSDLLTVYNIQESSSVSKVTLTERRITLESNRSTPQPVDIEAMAHDERS